MAIAAALVAQPLRAGIIASSAIVLTEDSPISLSAALNGSATGITVLNTSPDHWTVTFPTTISFNNPLNLLPAGWFEPDATGNLNVLSSPSSNNQLFVVSDTFQEFLHVTVIDGGNIDSIGIDSSGVTPVDVSVTFFDKGDATIPETGSTLSLLFLGSLILLGTSRFRSLRSA